MSIAFPRRKHRKSLRKLWLKTHLYIALTVGLFFAVLGVTGAVNVFYYELGELGLPAVPADPQRQPRALDEILQTVNAAHPQRTGGWFMLLPGQQGDYIWVEYPKPEETRDELFAPLEILVDPYSGEIVEQHFWGHTWLSLIYELHADLMMGKVGVEIGKRGFDIVCAFGIFLFISCLSGLYLWWPRWATLTTSLTVKLGAGRQRFYFDLHRAAGFYAAAILLPIAFTGFSFAYNDYVKTAVGWFSAVQADHLKDPKLKSVPFDSAQPIPIARAVQIADEVFPGAELREIGTPDGREGVYTVAKRQAGEANRIRPRSKVWIDQYSGRVLAVQDPYLFTPGETFMNLLWPLHDGQAFGLAGRIVWCATGVAPAVLYVTGLLRWLQKRRPATRSGISAG
ncbi:PepSY domain-containing protein [Methylococcus sp. EFPC2]|uniref:PepSY-associated TM helix domain-containing protein n=1 Tax=Methylococcus sp. EFPC2 TaxID=2812648 RepID=UPI0019687050|nr:PepSY-associated TM helix domain-containing protein [Methylococcus sp. EFPC2]QSA96008.1 PepSY domain-containing protein [Methylococcus sp. EFPC2]